MINILSYEEGEKYIEEGEFDYLPYEITYVFLENEEVIEVAFLVFDEQKKEIYIGNLDAAIESKGYGRKMINALKQFPDIEILTGEAGEVVIGFGRKMGAVFGDYNKTMEGYEFVISCNDSKK